MTDEEIWTAINEAHRIIESFRERLRKRLDDEDTVVLQINFLREEHLDELLKALALQPGRLKLTLRTPS